MDPADSESWLALLRVPGLGPAGVRQLLKRFGDPCSAISAPARERVGLGLSEEALLYLRAPDWSAIQTDLQWLQGPDQHLVTLGDPHYPARLKEIPDPPSVLFVRGEIAALERPQLAIVGSRNPTPIGSETALQFAESLAAMGVTITSGLALGIDTAGHRGALAADGFSNAVIGCGPDLVYPASNRSLASELSRRGAVITEYPTGTAPLAQNFPRRNRIISGLSLGVLVVEAAERSGSLITARLGMEQGREVFAIPGSIHNPMARGCHALLRQGAKLVETAQDILEEIGPQLSLGDRTTPASRPADDENPEPLLDEDYRDLLAMVGFEPTSVDRLVARSGLTAGVVSSMLLQLELRGYVSSISGGRYSRTTRILK